ncbi:MAG: TatD family hydrolase [Chloroflexota bacterium]|nr:TatD family hydrolase [Chloroflexota bacterium]
MIDSHAHLNAPQFDADRGEVLQRAWHGGLAAIVDVGTEPTEWTRSLPLAAGEGRVVSVLGLHPNSADLWSGATEHMLRSLLSPPNVVGIGETGLDYFRRGAAPEVQRVVFIAHLRLARELDLPVVIHARDAYEDILDVLQAHGQGTRGVLHSFAGSVEQALAGVDLGYYVSLSGPVTYRSGSGLRAVAAAVPLDRLLAETDSPYLPPHPHRGRRNEPVHLALTIAAIAQARDLDPQAVARATADNTVRLFGLQLPEGPSPQRLSETRNRTTR